MTNPLNPLDSTDPRQRLEEELRETQRLAVAGQFAAEVMHEINNPLEAVANLNYLIQQEAENVARVRQFSRMIDEQLALVFQISRRTLGFYRQTDTCELVAVGALAEAAIQVHRSKLTRKQIRLITRFPSNATVKVHQGEMLQVLSNLISNAVDALPENGTLCLRVKKCKGAVHVTIADDGHGIPKGIFSRIFEPFFTTKKDRGTGLGLAISKAIVEKHRGTIRGRSSTREGRSGTAFRITLPIEG